MTSNSSKKEKRPADWPKISVILPTYNAAGILDECLKAIAAQDYPTDAIELIVADGGSTDRTREIARSYHALVLDNPQKTGEHGKAVAIKKATGDILALIDSDNILTDRGYFKALVQTFRHTNVIGAQPIRFGYRRTDRSLNRYAALLGMVDPFVLFQGTYDHWSNVTGKWTAVPHDEKHERGYRLATFPGPIYPTIGANGFFIRRSIVEKYFRGDYYVDIDLVRQILQMDSKAAVAIVDTSVVHVFCRDLASFIKKQRRRIKDYLFAVQTGSRVQVREQKNLVGQILFILATVTIVPVLIQMVIGLVRRPDRAWFWHPVLCWITLGIYGWAFLKNRRRATIESRDGWRQSQ